MATIWMSMAGEGRGHATRTRTLVESLRAEHRLRLWAPAAAYDFLSECYTATDVTVSPLPGLQFRYRGHRVSRLRTAWSSLGYLCHLPGLITDLEREIDVAPPDLAVCDFEPALPRAARRAGVPVLSLDHQQTFRVCDFSYLPRNLQWKARKLSTLVSVFCPGSVEMVVSSFFAAPLKAEYAEVTQIGPLLRPAVLNTTRTNLGHLLVYLRRWAGREILDVLSGCGEQVFVYGLGARPPLGQLQFRPLSEDQFVKDLAAASAVICNAGNQLIGESLYLGKPLFVIPEPGQDEQLLNAWFLRHQLQAGDSVALEGFHPKRLRQFLDRRDDYRNRVSPETLRGNAAALAAISRNLPQDFNRKTPEISESSSAVAY